jgi:nicotinamidase-related amidase
MIIPLRQCRTEADIPLVVFIDLQATHVPCLSAPERCDTAEALENAGRLLAFARRHRMPIAHFRIRPRYACWGEQSSAWVSGFEPRGNEHVFERTRASCFSNASFERMLAMIRSPEIIFAGFSAEDGCLATAVDLNNRGYSGSFVKDCSFSKPLGTLGARETRAIVNDLIGRFAKIVALQEITGTDSFCSLATGQ